jgi:hypothetical protein
MRERTVDQACLLHVVSVGGLFLKITSPGTNGLFDRILLLPGCPVVFVEMKRSGEKPGKLQVNWAGVFRRYGQEVWSPIDSAEDFEERMNAWIAKHRETS